MADFPSKIKTEKKVSVFDGDFPACRVECSRVPMTTYSDANIFNKSLNNCTALSRVKKMKDPRSTLCIGSTNFLYYLFLQQDTTAISYLPTEFEEVDSSFTSEATHGKQVLSIVIQGAISIRIMIGLGQWALLINA